MWLSRSGHPKFIKPDKLKKPAEKQMTRQFRVAREPRKITL